MAVASICPHADKLTKEYTHEIADGARLMLFLALRFMLKNLCCVMLNPFMDKWENTQRKS